MQETNTLKRETAKIYPLKNIKNSEYFQEDNLKPNYIKTSIGNISRVNLICMVVMVQSNVKIIVDDGTATIEVYDFSNNIKNKNINSGDLILLIGKIRKINENICLVSEIISKNQINENPLWFHNRKKYIDNLLSTKNFNIDNSTNNLRNENNNINTNAKGNKTIEKNVNEIEDLDELEVPEYIETPKEIKFEIPSIEKTKNDFSEKDYLDSEVVLNYIKKCDVGKGCAIEEIISKFGENVEETINTLISMGDVYEFKSGFLKILE